MSNFHVEVVLAVFAGTDRGIAVLVEEEDGQLRLPEAFLHEYTTVQETAAKILMHTTGLAARIGGSGWVHLVQGNVADGIIRVRDVYGDLVRCVGIPFRCLIPESVEPKGKQKWLLVKEAVGREFVSDHKEIMIDLAKRV